MKENKTVFITKYALSSGIIECEMELAEDGKSIYGKPPGWTMAGGFYGNDFQLTWEAAQKDFESRKEKKIKSLQKQIDKLNTQNAKLNEK